MEPAAISSPPYGGASVPLSREKLVQELIGAITRDLFDRIPNLARAENHDVYAQILAIVEPAMVKAAMEKSGHRVQRAARGLGINRATLYRKLKKYPLRP